MFCNHSNIFSFWNQLFLKRDDDSDAVPDQELLNDNDNLFRLRKRSRVNLRSKGKNILPTFGSNDPKRILTNINPSELLLSIYV